jgi:hypothetical protein
MTTEDARNLIQYASAVDPDVVETAEITEAVVLLHDRASGLCDEAQREAARWLAANATRQFKSALELALSLPLAEMLKFMQSVRTMAAVTEDVRSPVRIGGILLQLIDALQEGLRNDWTRWESAPPDVRRRRVAGALLVPHDEDGQRSYLLSGRLVQDGVTLYLLTSAGWIAGIFHTATGDPLFTFRLPGAAEHELTIQIPTRALVTWSLD